MFFNSRNSKMIYSYLDLRKAVGWIGILLPFVLMLGLAVFFPKEQTPPSISHYYHTPMRDLFVGALCAVALFMFFYCGYTKLDKWVGNIVGIFAIGVAFFPTCKINGTLDLQSTVHYICATMFFLTLACFSFFIFTRTENKKKMSKQKKIRNIIYRACGIIMFVCMIGIVSHNPANKSSTLVFWFETIALVAFGVSWLTKGGTLYPDKNPIKEFLKHS